MASEGTDDSHKYEHPPKDRTLNLHSRLHPVSQPCFVEWFCVQFALVSAVISPPSRGVSACPEGFGNLETWG